MTRVALATIATLGNVGYAAVFMPGEDRMPTERAWARRADVSGITPSRMAIVRGYLLLPHVVPIIAVLLATGAFALIVARGWPGTWPMLCLLGAMLGGQLAVGATNELVDAELDARSRPHKPIPAGLVSRRGAIAMVLVGLAMMVAFSLAFSWPAFLLCAVGNGVGIAYSLWFKRTIWSWLPYVIAIPLIPIWVWTALDDLPRKMVGILPLAIPAVISLHIAQSLPDIGSDRSAGVRTLAVALGEDRARRWCWGCMLLSAAMAGSIAPWLADRPATVWIACAIAVGMVILNGLIWWRDARQGVIRCFPCMAVSAVALGIGCTLALVGP